MSDPILIIVTSHDRLGDRNEPTGFWYEELATPYRQQGADFTPFAVRDRQLVTGQNPMSSARTAELLLEALAERPPTGLA